MFNEDCYSENQEFHPLSPVSVEGIIQLSKVLKDKSNLNEIFNRINLIRPVGSSNHTLVRKFIRKYLSNLKWNVEEISFSTETVIGSMSFVNIIGTQNVTKSRRLVLACHYDSLKKDGFVGSIDSAMSCAMMLSIARILTPLLKRNNNVDVSLELIFFDGEEAFVSWSKSDSLYGSRYLASLWDATKFTDSCSRLNNIDALILLDLLGALRPTFYFFSTERFMLYTSLKRIENTIGQQQDIFKDLNHPYFLPYTIRHVVQDDHIPFMEKGVPFVHLIPIPFPPQWHKISDNAVNIDWNSSKDLELIFSVLVVQYFNLGQLLPTLQTFIV